jgi:nucleoside-diphosphate-sugar epimerase
VDVLITGSNGYIGSNLVSKFKRNRYIVGNCYSYSSNVHTGEEVNVIEHNRSICDLTDQRGLESFSQSIKPEVVIHTAAKANSVEYQNSQEVLYSNIIGTQNLIECFPDAYHIFFSSIVVYKSAGGFHKVSSNVGPKSVYGASKVACENLYNAANAISGTKSTSVRLCAVVGGENYTHGLINAIKSKIEQNPNEVELFGSSPGTVKPYIHIDDVFQYINNKLYLYIKKRLLKSGADILTTSKPLSVAEVAQIIFSQYGVNPEIKWNPSKVWKGDNKRINYRGYVGNMIYDTAKEALENINKEVY